MSETEGPMMEVCRVLMALDEIEWARLVGGDAPLRPPFIYWRFKNPDHEIEEKIVEAVKAYSGRTKWIIFKGRRNWVIAPELFERFARDFQVYGDAVRCFGSQFPQATAEALADVNALALHLRKYILPH